MKNKTYSQQIGESLAETLSELFVLDDFSRLPKSKQLEEIRSLEKLQMQANQALLNNNPVQQQKLERAIMLKKRKRSVMMDMGEDELGRIPWEKKHNIPGKATKKVDTPVCRACNAGDHEMPLGKENCGCRCHGN